MQPHAHLIPCHKQLRERDKRERKDEGKHTEEKEVWERRDKKGIKRGKEQRIKDES